MPIARIKLLLLSLLCTFPHAARCQDAPAVLKSAPMLSSSPADDDSQSPVFITADKIQGTKEEQVEAEGAVELRRRGQAIFADHLRYDRDNETVSATGNVRVEQGRDAISGPELHMRLDESSGYMVTPIFKLGEIGARADASRLEFEGKEKIRLTDARYTTCPIGDDDWFLRAKNLELNRTTQIGTARNVSVVFQGVPLVYLPWLDFPLNNQRKSGFLTPTVGSSDKRGFEAVLPYYWNIAPNRDATISPRILTKRGLQLNSEFRYLEPKYSGQAAVELLPNDRVANKDRYAYSVQHQHAINEKWTGMLNLQRVSDDDYFRDLSTRIANTSQTHLPQEGALSYHRYPWDFVGRIQRFQTLQDPDAPITPPYDRVPQLVLNGSKRNLHGLDFGISSEFVGFRHPTSANGERFIAYPNASWPLGNSFFYVTPKAGWHYTQYNLESTTTALPNSSRSLPIFSVDSGFIFERDTRLRNQDYVQTLEPRAYYLYIPYKDQSLIPNFDTGELDFNFSQMFSENQFSGGDRINDANQLTLALTTRLLEADSGQERWRAAIGQRFYFKEQQVTLNTPRRTDKSSDIVAALYGQITREWGVDTAWQYSTNPGRTHKLGIATTYRPQPGKLINLGYRFTRDEIKQVDISTQWPLSSRLSALARWNYSLRDKQVLEALAGLEYNGGCWALRAVMHRFATSATETSNDFYIQLELFGMGKLGANPLDVLKRNISGYAQSNEFSRE